jgi:hypothetical protein
VPDLNTLLSGLVIGGIVALAYLAGLATRPASRLASDWSKRLASRRRADQRQLLQDLPQLLPELQKAGESAGDPDGYERYLDLDRQVADARNRIANRQLRDQVRRYQQRVASLAAFHREDAARPPLLEESGEVDGAQAMGRVHAALMARKDAYVGLSRVMTGISEEIRRL